MKQKYKFKLKDDIPYKWVHKSHLKITLFGTFINKVFLAFGIFFYFQVKNVGANTGGPYEGQLVFFS